MHSQPILNSVTLKQETLGYENSQQKCVCWP